MNSVKVELTTPDTVFVRGSIWEHESSKELFMLVGNGVSGYAASSLWDGNFWRGICESKSDAVAGLIFAAKEVSIVVKDREAK